MKIKSQWEQFFDGHAPVYDTNCFTKNTVAEVDFLIGELGLRPGESVLDVGCGAGRHAVELARRGCAVTGLDLSSGMLREAEKAAAAAGVAVTWQRGDAARFSADREYDAVICLCEGAFGLLGARDDAIGQPLSILRNVAAALKPNAKCLFTVLNGFAMIRRHPQADVGQGIYDPMTCAERSECDPAAAPDPPLMRERGFVPTELVLLFSLANLDVLNIWGGTAGNWGKRPIDLDEMEIMVLARKVEEGGTGVAGDRFLDALMSRARSTRSPGG
jgi:SAM-dependent methyltransferase